MGAWVTRPERPKGPKSSRPEGPKAGPKGRQLEVGPRRGPRLLVYVYYCVLSENLWRGMPDELMLEEKEAPEQPSQPKHRHGTHNADDDKI